MSVRASIRPLKEDDYSLIVAWLSDPNINRWLYAEWRDRVIDERLIAFAASGRKNRMWLGLADDQPYGLVTIGNVSPLDRSGIAWYLRGSQIERIPGVMTRCVAMAMKAAFQSLDLHSISASIQADNIASEHLLRAVGFRLVGVLREAFYVDGRFVDRVQFDLLEQDLTRQ